MLARLHLDDRTSWLAARAAQGIGASECAAVVGMSPWMTPTELWQVKTGQRENKDLSGNDAVERGNRMEDAIRYFYACSHPDYAIEHHPYDILYQSERSWQFATLDGEVTTPDGRHGILEIKTASPSGKEQWSQWDGRVPDGYFVQCLAQLLATGYDFVVLQAALWNRAGDVTLKDPYLFERADHEADLNWLLDKLTRFWNSVQTKTIPKLTIKF